MTNYEMLIKTVNELASSQGFYSRLSKNLASLTEEEKQRLETELNSKPQFKDSVDVILFLES